MTSQPAESLNQRVRSMSPSEGRAALVEHISAALLELLDETRSQTRRVSLRADLPILALALPSLRLIELKDRLEQLFQVEVPVVLFFEQVTIDGLVAHMLSRLGLTATGERDRGHTEAIADGAPPLRPEDILAMSEEEAEARLLQCIEDLSRSEP